MRSPLARKLGCLLALLLGPTTALACKVPVFRYALERWHVDDYQLVAIVDGPPDDQVRAALEQLESLGDSDLNVAVNVVDLATLSESQLWQLEAYDGSADPPLLQVFYPEKDARRHKCWEGELTVESLSRWSRSPLRQQISDDLVSGASAVFLLVDGNDPAQNDQLEMDLKRWLANAAKEIEIPAGVIPLAGAAEYLKARPDATMDDVLRSDIPLKVEFRVRRLVQEEAAESALRAMVAGLKNLSDQPRVVPIFGRGRMLDVIDAAECDEGLIANACRYIVGECSCTVKAQNPGVDMLLSVDWSERLGESFVMVEAPTGDEPKLLAIAAGDRPLPPSATTDYPVRLTTWGAAIALIMVAAGLLWIRVLRKAGS